MVLQPSVKISSSTMEKQVFSGFRFNASSYSDTSEHQLFFGSLKFCNKDIKDQEIRKAIRKTYIVMVNKTFSGTLPMLKNKRSKQNLGNITIHNGNK